MFDGAYPLVAMTHRASASTGRCWNAIVTFYEENVCCSFSHKIHVILSTIDHENETRLTRLRSSFPFIYLN